MKEEFKDTIKRYLLVTSGSEAATGNPLKCSGTAIDSYHTREEACTALKKIFEKHVAAVLGESHTVEYSSRKSALYSDGSTMYAAFMGFNRGIDLPHFVIMRKHDGEDDGCDDFIGAIQELEIELTNDEFEMAYRKRDNDYRLMDAEDHLMSFIGYDPDSDPEGEDGAYEETAEEFKANYGFSLDGAIDPNSPNYILQDLADKFFEECDCNTPENDTWYHIITEYLDDIRIHRKT